MELVGSPTANVVELSDLKSQSQAQSGSAKGIKEAMNKWH
jgi:hypothetical protein